MSQRSPINLCGSLSLHPVAAGARMHNAGYEALGLPYVYVPFAITHTNLRNAIEGMRALGIRGLGVSMPFKVDVIPLLDHVDATAGAIGAVNTIVNDDGVLTGHNTDWVGALRALEEGINTKRIVHKMGQTTGAPECNGANEPLAGRPVLVVGAGGAARAIVFGLVGAGALVTVCNRTRDKAEQLAQAAHAERACSLSDLTTLDPFEVVVNATSIGMGNRSNLSIFEDRWLTRRLLVMDIVYDPARTRLVMEAEAHGATTIDGTRMLLHQAAAQFELYTGCRAPFEVMDRASRVDASRERSPQ